MKLTKETVVAFAVMAGWCSSVALTSCAPRQDRQRTEPGSVAEHQAAPVFELPLLEGGQLSLAEKKGQNIVILDFWATWCGPCRMAMPLLAEVASDFRERGVQLYAVNLREDAATIRPFLEKNGLDIEVALDSRGEVASLYGVEGIPQTVVIDKNGMIADVHVGYSPHLKEELAAVLTSLVGS